MSPSYWSDIFPFFHPILRLIISKPWLYDLNTEIVLQFSGMPRPKSFSLIDAFAILAGRRRKEIDMDVLLPGAYGLAKAAAHIGISPRKLWALKAAGEISHFCIGKRVLFRIVDLNAYMAARVEENKRTQTAKKKRLRD